MNTGEEVGIDDELDGNVGADGCVGTAGAWSVTQPVKAINSGNKPATVTLTSIFFMVSPWRYVSSLFLT